VLDAFIIDQLRKRDEKREDSRPVLQIPIPTEPMPNRERLPTRDPEERDRADDVEEDDDQRGVIVIDFAGQG
jgi:hypothetical protein